jgi:transposase-like protein
MTVLSSDDYVMMGGKRCPNNDCKSEDITTTKMQADVGIAWQSCTCDDCGMHWTDEYKLIGYDIDD